MCYEYGTNAYSDGVFIIKKKDEYSARFGYNENENGNGFVLKTNIEGDIKITEKICGYKVVSLLNRCLRFCNKITSLTLPETLKKIEGGGLTAVQNIEKIVIPKSVEFIGTCTDFFTILKKFEFAKGSRVSSIGDYFLRYSKAIEEVILPQSVTSIGIDLCDNCIKLEKLFYCGKSNIASLTNPFNACPLKAVIVPIYHSYRKAFSQVHNLTLKKQIEGEVFH